MMITTEESRAEVGSVSAPFLLAVLAIYALTVFVSRMFFRLEVWNLAMIWPAAGVGVFAALRVRGRRLFALLAGMALVNMVITPLTGLGVWHSVGYALGNAGECLVAKETLVRLRRIRRERSGAVALLCIGLSSILASVSSGVLAAAWATPRMSATFTEIWWQWTNNHCLGILLVVTGLLPWTGMQYTTQERKAGRIECALYCLMLLVVSYASYAHPLGPTHFLPSVALPILMWSAYRLPLGFTTVGGLAVALATVFATGAGHGLFALLPVAPQTRMSAAELFATVIHLTCALVALLFYERRSAEQKARTSEQKYRKLVEAAEEGIWIIDTACRTTFVNAKMAAMLGYSPEEMLGRHLLEFMDEGMAAQSSAQQPGRVTRGPIEWRYRRKDGTSLWVWESVSAIDDEEGAWTASIALMSDITEYKRVAHEREVTIEFLRIANQAAQTRDLIRAATVFFQKQSGCEAVGIRLREGDDYPYFEASGFTSEFLARENRLCHSAPIGAEPVLDCMCGTVISGRFDSSKPFFTKAGSFWTNSTTHLLAVTSEKDRQSRTRNTCNKLGYESVALIPLCVGDQRLGLLQLNDHRKGVFSREDINSWERLAGYLAVALAKCRAEDALRDSERKNRSLLEQASDAIFTISVSGDLLTANPKTSELLGYPLQELLGLKFNQFVSYSDLTEGATRQALNQGQTVLMEKDYRRKDGSLVAVESSLKKLSDESIQVIARDITGRRAAEQALRLSESRFRSLVQNAPYGMYRITWEGRLTSANPRLLEMLGYACEDELLRVAPVDLFYHPEQWSSFMEEVHRHDEVRGVEALWRRKDGRQITVRLSGRAVSGDSHFEVVAEDISESVRLEAELRQAQKLEALGALAGGVAHDFNNVLMIIYAYTEMMLKDLPEDHPARLLVQKVIHASDRGAKLTRQLLAFSRKQVLSTSLVDLNTVIAELGSMLQPLIGEDIMLELGSEPELWPVRADRGQLEQVILNLAVNARDAMPNGGRLSVGVRNVYLDGSVMRGDGVALVGEYVDLSVADDGCGMSPETMSRIFEPFFTTKGMGKGTGLGLSTVYGIVRQSEGHITVTSQEGQGTAFHVYLPRAAHFDTGTATSEQSPIRAGGNANILVVEDEEAAREAICAYLQQTGFRVTPASDAVQALHVCEQQMPDLILTDVVLPGSSGVDFIDKVSCRHAQLKVIFMSGYADNRIRPEILARAGSAFLQKPFALPELVRQIQHLL